MKKLLDILFSNKKLSIAIPLFIAAVALLLCILFGNTVSKINTVFTGLILSVIWFFGVYFILMIQIKNTSCPDWFLNLFEFLIIFAFGIYAIISMIKFIISGFNFFDFVICLGFVTYSATAWAHSKRQ